MTAAQKFIQRNPAGAGLTENTATTSGGAGNEGKIPALDPTTGLLNVNMMPTGIGPEIDSGGICGTTSLTAGMLVNIYDNGGQKTVRPADNTDATKPPHGFVLAAYSVSDPVTVYMPSQTNNLIPLGAFVAADVGKPLYLGTVGAVTLTRLASGTGKLDMQVGEVDAVGATVSSVFKPTTPIVLA
jgi:hypothetical protein